MFYLYFVFFSFFIWRVCESAPTNPHNNKKETKISHFATHIYSFSFGVIFIENFYSDKNKTTLTIAIFI